MIHLNKFYNSLDIFVFPSLNEGFGRPLGEALHCGLPIVACNASTSPEILGKSGVLVDPTIEGMVNGVKPLIEDETLRKKFSNLSLERAKIIKLLNTDNPVKDSPVHFKGAITPGRAIELVNEIEKVRIHAPTQGFIEFPIEKNFIFHPLQ